MRRKKIDNHQFIDMHIGPTLVEAKLISDSVCDCGMKCFKEDTAIGTPYQVDLRSVRWVRFKCFGCGKTLELRIIDAWSPLLLAQWTFLDSLDIAEMLPAINKPDSEGWVAVKDNSVAPAHHVPWRIM
jgi:hypothetical protein